MRILNRTKSIIFVLSRINSFPFDYCPITLWSVVLENMDKSFNILLTLTLCKFMLWVFTANVTPITLNLFSVLLMKRVCICAPQSNTAVLFFWTSLVWIEWSEINDHLIVQSGAVYIMGVNSYRSTISMERQVCNCRENTYVDFLSHIPKTFAYH